MRRLTLVLACCGFPLASASPQQRAVTLAEALELAQRNAPAVVQAQGNARAAGAGVRSAWGEYLPRLSASSSYGSSFSEGPARIDPITQQVISGKMLKIICNEAAPHSGSSCTSAHARTIASLAVISSGSPSPP